MTDEAYMEGWEPGEAPDEGAGHDSEVVIVVRVTLWADTDVPDALEGFFEQLDSLLDTAISDVKNRRVEAWLGERLFEG